MKKKTYAVVTVVLVIVSLALAVVFFIVKPGTRLYETSSNLVTNERTLDEW